MKKREWQRPIKIRHKTLTSNLINSNKQNQILPSHSNFDKPARSLTRNQPGEKMNSLSLSVNYTGLFPSYRLFVAIMTSIAMFLGYALMTNFSVAIVRMTYHEPSPGDAASSCDLFQVIFQNFGPLNLLWNPLLAPNSWQVGNDQQMMARKVWYFKMR